MKDETLPANKKAGNSPPPTIGTHNGTFHCDEVLACFMLKQLPEYENAIIFRSRDSEQLHEKCDIIVDVGGVFDHERKLYDHHQKSFTETMSSLNPQFGNEFNIRLSSAGLVYNYYGERIIQEILKRHRKIELSEDNLKLVYKCIYKKFISEIDAIDNGIPMFEKNVEPLYTISTHLSARIQDLNPSWDDNDDQVNIDERFQKAVEMTGEEFTRKVVNIGCSWLNTREYVKRAIEKRKDILDSGEIIVLEKFCPWRLHLDDLEKEYNIEGVLKLVLFADSIEGWRVAGVPIALGSFVGRKFLPPAWRGLRDGELCSAAGISDLTFVHYNGFIGGAKTKEAAIKMAIKSVTMSEEKEDRTT